MKLAAKARPTRRGGTVTVNGGGALTGDNLNIRAKINRLRPLAAPRCACAAIGRGIGYGQRDATGDRRRNYRGQGRSASGQHCHGRGSVTTLPISTPATEKAAAEKAAAKRRILKDRAKLNVRINMPPRFSVEGRGLTSLWEAHLLIGGTPADPVITGSVSCYKGTFDFLGKEFCADPRRVTFAGGSLANPLLDIELTNETPDLTAHLLITGPVSKMKLDLTSDPSLPRDDILSRVLFGRSLK